MIRQAVILAAGLGARLQGVDHQGPKGLLRLGDGPSLIVRSLARLRRAGIERVVVITGHQAEQYETALAKRAGVVCHHNPAFSTSGSGGSLCTAARVVNGSFLLLESDIAYEYRALEALLQDDRTDLVLAGRSPMHDKVYVRQDRRGVLTHLDKSDSSAASACGELTGLAKISDAFRVSLSTWSPPAGGGWDYEQALVALAPRHDLQVLTRPELLWFEVDDARHHQQAKDGLWAALQQRDPDEASP